jgi:competence protein ComEC
VHGVPCHFFFKKSQGSIIVFASCLIVACNLGWHDRPAEKPATFAVFDVGEGLAQAVKVGDDAVLFDMGPPDEYPKWKDQFNAFGRPSIKAIVLSHDHLDHWGGLQRLDSSLSWTGLLVVTKFEDTALIRNCVPQWRNRIRFHTIVAHDTLELLDKVDLCCLWPPDTSGDSLFAVDSLKNRYSMVFLVHSGLTNALITSDIDSVTMRELSQSDTIGLTADVMVVPHHGSSGSLYPVFYGYVRPQVAVISCGAVNLYGHPSREVLLWLNQMGITVKLTSLDGGVVMESNGYCWTAASVLH